MVNNLRRRNWLHHLGNALKHASQRNKMKMTLVDALWYKVQDTVKFDLQELCLQTMAAISERATSKNFHATVFLWDNQPEFTFMTFIVALDTFDNVKKCLLHRILLEENWNWFSTVTNKQTILGLKGIMVDWFEHGAMKKCVRSVFFFFF